MNVGYKLFWLREVAYLVKLWDTFGYKREDRPVLFIRHHCLISQNVYT